jgi:2-polyprenyl-3-methyl-5-hydroxy-6-metoxy-1,4-benzoquinol methylase
MKNNNTDKKMYFYESFAATFDSKMNMYDTRKRMDVIYNELLTQDIKGKSLLDAGCGTGWFSKMAVERGAVVTSMDLGENLLQEVKKKCESTRVVGSILEMPFENDSFDVIVSSEVIEHTPNPHKAIEELARVLKPNGILVLTTPNKFWYFSIWIANKLHIRPYEGLENWLGWREMERTLEGNGLKIENMVGIHLFPFIFSFLNPVLDFFHQYNKFFGPVMVNMAAKCKK